MAPKVGEYYADSFHTVAIIDEVLDNEVKYTIVLDTLDAPSLTHCISLRDFNTMVITGGARKLASPEQVKALEILYGKIQKR